MTLISILRESVSSARGQRVASAVVALIVASMCVTTLLTVGRTVAAEAQIQQRLEQAGSRRIVIDDVAHQGFISAAVVNVLGSYSSVDHAIGVSGPVEAVNHGVGRGGRSVPAWTIAGDQSAMAELTSGRWPEPGEALVSVHAIASLGMDHPSGALLTPDNGRAVSVVGAFRTRPGFHEFAAGALIRAEPGASSDSVELIASNAQAVESTQNAALALLARPNTQDVSVDSPVTLADVQQQVIGDLRFSNRWLVLLVLGAGSLLTMIVVLGGVLMGRTDLGRRRALGASRATLTTLVVVRSAVISGVAVTVGTAMGTAVAVIEHQRPDAPFTLAVACLALLSAVLSSLVPAFLAAYQDPLQVLRTP